MLGPWALWLLLLAGLLLIAWLIAPDVVLARRPIPFAPAIARDWPLIIVILGFALVMPWRALFGLILPGLLPHPGSPFAAYEAALHIAAIKTPGDRHRLRTLDTEQVQLVNFRNSPLTLDADKLPRDVWAALPGELRDTCTGADDPVLRLQQVLGLPQRSGTFALYPVTVQRAAVLRPCMSGDPPTAGECSFDLPADPTAGEAAAPVKPADPLAARYQTLQDAYRKLRLVAGQMWSVYRIGFVDRWAHDGDYPYTGYPFTGMGWSYDWNPAASSHVGVSEFVIPKGTAATLGTPTDPATFCAAPPG